MLVAVSRLIYTVKVVGVITLQLFDINIFSMPRIFFNFYCTFFCYYRTIYV